MFAEPIRRLTEQHRALEDEPLHLALPYGPPRDREDIFLFEVIGGTESLNPEGDLFEATFLPALGFPLAPGQKLHLILTNPEELKEAVRRDWPLAQEILQALRSVDNHQVLHADKVGRKILQFLRGEARRRETLRG
jgi:hypothetical protein